MKVIISRSESGTNAALFVGELPQGITDRQIEDAVRSLERPPAASPWIPVTERLPVAGDHNHKLVRCRRWDNEVTWNRAWYDGQTWHGSGSMAGVEAWAEIDLQKEEEA